MPAGRPVLVDTDAGVDDALALLAVLGSGAVDVVGIGSTYGNCPVEVAARNARCVLEVAGRPEVPVAVGLAQPEDSWVPAAAEVHGPDGLGNRAWEPSIPPSDEAAVEQLLRLSREYEGRLELLALGPLTNLAAALALDPGVLARCRRVVVMGGMGLPARVSEISAQYPNYQVVGDPNTWHNPRAAGAVVAADGPMSWVGMDVTGRIRLPEALLTQAAPEHAVARFVAAITEYYCGFVTRTSNTKARMFTIHDTVAAAVLLDPDLALQTTTSSVVLDYARDHRGGIWADPTGQAGWPRHQVIAEVDVPTIVDRVVDTIAH